MRKRPTPHPRRSAPVTVVSIQATGTTETVHNLTIAGLHNYYVAAHTTHILVHNDCTTEDLYRAGNASGPRAPRLNQDYELDESGMVKPVPLDIDITQVEVKGASSFRELKEMTLTGHIHRIDAGTPLPEGLAVIKDGEAVEGLAPTGHRSIVPTRSMTVEEFTSKLGQIPSKFVTKIKK